MIWKIYVSTSYLNWYTYLPKKKKGSYETEIYIIL